MKILITGGAGYIGSHTCKGLKQAGYTPITYDNLSRGFDWAVQWGPLVIGDLHDTDLLIKTIEDHEIKSIIHFAAYAYVGESCDQPEIYYQNNVAGSISLFEAARETSVENIVFSSTCSIYGNVNLGPVTEDDPVDPINPYATSKYMVEQILKDYAERHSMNYGILRYFNAGGADFDGDIGEAHDPEPHIIPIAMNAALTQSNELTVFGHDYDTKDGTCVRDYVHVCDLAKAHILALEKLTKEQTSFLINLGTETGFTILELLEAIEKVVGKPVPYIMGERRKGDPAKLIASIDKARSELGWIPQYSSIETLIASALNWINKKNNG